MTLLDELRSERPRMRGCVVCVYIASRPERAEWVEAFADTTIATATIFRAMKARGYGFADSAVSKHRRERHALAA